ncbi:MAG TPA: ATP-binding cassette domain-containing protein [Vicinamibacterales bacterium]|jgi:zinc transport system ATP-binding protein|nr:ATP-binding cassette domain-containing protein [Vicinamibacterales bacterium]
MTSATDEEAEPALLEVDRVTVRRNREALLDEVSLRVRRGSIHVLVGSNGAGKSTLLTAILGQIVFDGQIAVNWAASGAIGYVPQTFAVDSTLPVTVTDFLALTRQRRPVCLGIAPATRRAIGGLLARAGISALEDRPLAALSGGELRRVLLVHALDPEPELLLLDEPAAGLDESAARALEDTLVSLRRAARTTILMVSHDVDQVRRIADRVTVLDRRVVADGVTELALGASRPWGQR